MLILGFILLAMVE